LSIRLVLQTRMSVGCEALVGGAYTKVHHHSPFCCHDTVTNGALLLAAGLLSNAMDGSRCVFGKHFGRQRNLDEADRLAPDT